MLATRWLKEGEPTIQSPLGPQPVKQEPNSQLYADARQLVPGEPGGATALVRERMVVRIAREGTERCILSGVVIWWMDCREIVDSGRILL